MAVPTGVTTTILGAVVIVSLARKSRDAGPTQKPPGSDVAARSRGRFLLVLALGVAGVLGTLVLGLLAGHTWLQTGDVALWLRGDATRAIQFSLDERAPRVVAAVLAGAGLALSGALVQASCRNPLAEPGLLGITGGAGLAAVIGLTQADVSANGLLVLAVFGALAAFGLVYALSWKGGFQSDRLVLIGIGTWYGATALSTYFLVRANPWDTPRVYTWLSGTTYGRSWEDLLPVAVVLLISVPLVLSVRRDLDLLALDDDAPRLAGIRLERVRLTVLAVSALLAATSVLAVGVVGFVGLVSPHAARALLRLALDVAVVGADEADKTLQRRRLDVLIGKRLAQKRVEHVVRLASEPRPESPAATVGAKNAGEELERSDLIRHSSPDIELLGYLFEALVFSVAQCIP
jgi:iron complex transport system permease protein